MTPRPPRFALVHLRYLFPFEIEYPRTLKFYLQEHGYQLRFDYKQEFMGKLVRVYHLVRPHRRAPKGEVYIVHPRGEYVPKI